MKIILKNAVRSSIFASFIVFGLNGILHADQDDKSSMGQSSSQGSSMSGSSSSERGDIRHPSHESDSSGDTGMAPSSTGSDSAPGTSQRKGVTGGEGGSATRQPSPQGSSTSGGSSSDRENMQRNH
ncbi:hypothetical protein [Nitrosomonas sp. Nm58]|jgi:hypothetical protein|uniref:hypothetical protein n=1 Tax=Nitrosomonas sp. Nm58 TaxID=200126 RepID=UPI0008946590|nr:hypothetical protein [Nitrosomonas sp. Nm58]SDZ16827.1 hypothetical protein SAMN05421754_10812 [Nitrosomonas sp. Nm58]